MTKKQSASASELSWRPKGSKLKRLAIAVRPKRSCASRPDVAVMDQYLPDGNALDLLPKLKAIDPQVPVIILTGYGSIDMAVRTIKEGAENFLTKPVDLSTRLVILQQLLESPRNRQKELAGKTRQARVHIDPFVGTSAAVPPNV